jgi:hypothetical protein
LEHGLQCILHVMVGGERMTEVFNLGDHLPDSSASIRYLNILTVFISKWELG